MSKVKFGVIGLGWFGEKHCEALASVPGVQLHSLCRDIVWLGCGWPSISCFSRVT